MKKNAFSSYALTLILTLLGPGAMLVAYVLLQVDNLLLEIMLIVVLLAMVAGIGACLGVLLAQREALEEVAKQEWGKGDHRASEH